MRYIISLICLLSFLFIATFSSAAIAGNKEMVEERVKEMDDLNKEMVKQIPDLPKSGKVEAKANVTTEGGKINFEVYQIKSTAKETSLDFGGGQQKDGSCAEARPESKKKIPDATK
jgi:hypothetical protein